MATSQTTSSSQRAVRRFPCASLLLAAGAIIIFVFPALAEALQFDRAAIMTGEIWRLITGHWTHWTLEHAFWDILMFTVLAGFLERYGQGRMLACALVSAAAISAGVWLRLDQMLLYRGLSGVDSALFTLAAAVVLERAVRRGNGRLAAASLICLVAFTGKVIFELMTGAALFVDGSAADFAPVPLAHVIGGVIGLTFAWREILAIVPTRMPKLATV